MAESKRARLEGQAQQLSKDRTSFEGHWRELADYILPHRPRFFTSDRSSAGNRHNKNIIDFRGTIAQRTLTSGLMSGVTSPARAWFRLALPVDGKDEIPSVKAWLYETQQILQHELSKSDLYKVLPGVYDDLGTFGTAAAAIQENFVIGEAPFRFMSFPVGSYWLGNDANNRVGVFYREFALTVRQLVGDYNTQGRPISEPDPAVFSRRVLDLVRTGKWEELVDVCHIVLPNPDYVAASMLSKDKRFWSCHWEKGSKDGDQNKFLRESGMDEFHIFGLRWQANGEDAYATMCPGMVALGDVKMLQQLQRRKLQAVDKMVNPPMVYPASMRSGKVSILPGDSNFADERDGQKTIRPAHEVNVPLGELDLVIQETQRRIDQAYFADLFLMLAQDERNERPTATEVQERKEEKLLALGPVLQQLDVELLRPLVLQALRILSVRGMLPEPPEEMRGMELKVEFISMLASAQKLVEIGGLDRFTQTMMNLAPVFPDVVKKVNSAEVADAYAELLSPRPGVLRSDEEVAAMKQAEARAVQQQMQAEQVAQEAKAAQSLAAAKTSEPSALTELMDMGRSNSLIPQ